MIVLKTYKKKETIKIDFFHSFSENSVLASRGLIKFHLKLKNNTGIKSSAMYPLAVKSWTFVKIRDFYMPTL